MANSDSYSLSEDLCLQCGKEFDYGTALMLLTLDNVVHRSLCSDSCADLFVEEYGNE